MHKLPTASVSSDQGPSDQLLIDLRRTIHRHPELGLATPTTQSAVLAALAGLPLEITTGRDCTSVVAVLRGDGSGRAVLLRADMDALPLTEATGVEFASQISGRMHACGHDLHTAALVGAAHLLSQRQRELPGDVIFMFQPGEESGGGAQCMLDEGVLSAADDGQALRPVVGAYALHVAPGTRHRFSTRAGATLAGCGVLQVSVYGRGGHAGLPRETVDPLPLMMDLARALPAGLVGANPARPFEGEGVQCTVTMVSASDTPSVIADRAWFSASSRALSEQALDEVHARALAIAQPLARDTGCRVEIEHQVGEPPTMSAPEHAALCLDALARQFGADRVCEAEAPLMAAEDFSRVLRLVPGAYLFIEATPDDGGIVEGNHSPRVRYDEALLGDMAEALATIAQASLARAVRLTHQPRARHCER